LAIAKVISQSAMSVPSTAGAIEQIYRSDLFDRVLARDSNDGFVNTDQQAGVTGGSYSA